MMLLLQNVALVFGVVSLIVAGWQDKLTRIAPAIYFSPILLGFAFNPLMGLVGLILTIVLYKFWGEEYDKYVGLGDVLLLISVIFALINAFTSWIMIVTLVFTLIDLKVFIKELKIPLIWVLTKWLTLILSIIAMVVIIG
jgi:hypothetical protein